MGTDRASSRALELDPPSADGRPVDDAALAGDVASGALELDLPSADGRRVDGGALAGDLAGGVSCTRARQPRPRPRPRLFGGEFSMGDLRSEPVATAGAVSVPAMRMANIINCIHQDVGCDNCSPQDPAQDREFNHSTNTQTHECACAVV